MLICFFFRVIGWWAKWLDEPEGSIKHSQKKRGVKTKNLKKNSPVRCPLKFANTLTGKLRTHAYTKHFFLGKWFSRCFKSPWRRHNNTLKNYCTTRARDQFPHHFFFPTLQSNKIKRDREKTREIKVCRKKFFFFFFFFFSLF